MKKFDEVSRYKKQTSEMKFTYTDLYSSLLLDLHMDRKGLRLNTSLMDRIHLKYTFKSHKDNEARTDVGEEISNDVLIIIVGFIIHERSTVFCISSTSALLYSVNYQNYIEGEQRNKCPSL